jgi:transcriptional regulator, propionate catabolism operon regulatory protein
VRGYAAHLILEPTGDFYFDEYGDYLSDGDKSAPIEGVRSLVHRYAKSDATVLILGESGTGKEMIAQGMHQLSARRDFAFVAINCGAFPEALLESELFGYEEGAFTGARKGGKAGLIEAAHRGTLFLDEIGEMPLPLQSRLLRVLQEREVVRLGSTEPTRVDIRVVAATNRALTEGIGAGTFRADLYYRLNILSIALPPLREREADVMLLAAGLLLQAATREPRLSGRVSGLQSASRVLEQVREPLNRYHWPGNVRELQNVIERIAVELADTQGAVFTRDMLDVVAPELFVVNKTQGMNGRPDDPKTCAIQASGSSVRLEPTERFFVANVRTTPSVADL